MPSAHFERVWKMFGETVTLRNLTLDVHEGELLVLVGASGCGKTTSLRLLAGLRNSLPTARFRSATATSQFFRPVNATSRWSFRATRQSSRTPCPSAGNLSFGPRMRKELQAATSLTG